MSSRSDRHDASPQAPDRTGDEAVDRVLADLATCCRILAAEGHEHFFLGHVSARHPHRPELAYVKRTGIGLADITTTDFLLIDLDGNLLEGDGALHHEVPIHTAILRHRGDVSCVIHTHPPFATALSASSGRFELVSQDSIPFAGRLRQYASAALVVTAADGDALALALGDGNAVIMCNHGITVAGTEVAEATFLAVSLERSLATQARMAAFGAPAAISGEQAAAMASYFERSYAGRVATVWRDLARRVELAEPAAARHPLLDALAARGIAEVPPARWQELAAECHACAHATGDARYPVLRSVLLRTAAWWDEQGGVPRALADRIDETVRRLLPEALGTPSPRFGYALAAGMTEELTAVLMGTNEWVRQGYVHQVE